MPSFDGRWDPVAESGHVTFAVRLSGVAAGLVVLQAASRAAVQMSKVLNMAAFLACLNLWRRRFTG